MNAGYHLRADDHRQPRQVYQLVDSLSECYGVPDWQPSEKPVDELVLTILSQNTSDTNTERGYRSLRDTFPTWHAARDASTDDIVKAIRVAGLADQKAPRIKKALQQLVHDDDLDPNRTLLEELGSLGQAAAKARLLALDGVGPKTAACVLLFALGMPALPVDTHVHRVSRRLGLIGPSVSAERAHDSLEEIVPPELTFAFHVLLIQHGRRVCRARRPHCPDCSLLDICSFGLSTVSGSVRRTHVASTR